MIRQLDPNEVRYFMIHCSDSPQNRGDTAATIHQWHTTYPFNFDCIGYHKVILEDGTIEDGRPEYIQGAHCKGYNHCSLGICLIGTGDYTVRQLRSLKALIQSLKGKYKKGLVAGHYQFDKKKSCPNMDIPDLMNRFSISYFYKT